MTVNAVSNNYVVYDANGKSKTVNKNDEEFVFNAGKDSTNTIDLDYACTDGNDDGKISFGEGVKSFFKGIGKTAVNMVVGPIKELANGNPVPALLAGAGIAATAIIGAPAVVALGAIGVVTGGVQAISGISKAMSAETDGEAKAALEQTGGGVFTAGVSALAVKGGLKSMESSITKMGKTSELAKVNEQIKAGDIKGFGKLTSKVKAYGADSKTIINNKFNGVLTKAEGKIADTKERVADAKAHKEFIKENGLQDEKILTQDEIDALIQEQQKPVTSEAKPVETKAGAATKTEAPASNGQPRNLTQSHGKPTIELSVEQAEAELKLAQQMLQEGIDSRAMTKADYEAGVNLVKEAQVNLDAAKLRASQGIPTRQEAGTQLVDVLKQVADQKNTAGAPQPKADPMANYFVEGADGQMEFNFDAINGTKTAGAGETAAATTLKPGAIEPSAFQPTQVEVNGQTYTVFKGGISNGKTAFTWDELGIKDLTLYKGGLNDGTATTSFADFIQGSSKLNPQAGTVKPWLTFEEATVFDT